MTTTELQVPYYEQRTARGRSCPTVLTQKLELFRKTGPPHPPAAADPKRGQYCLRLSTSDLVHAFLQQEETERTEIVPDTPFPLFTPVQ